MPKQAAHHEHPAHAVQPSPVEASTPKPKGNVTRLMLPSSVKGRVATAVLAVIALALILFAIPYTRYGLLGQVFKRAIVINTVDSHTHKPVSDVTIKIGSQKAVTDAKGQAKFAQVPVGGWDVLASKKYYNLVDSNIMVPLLGAPTPFQFQLVAIGNQVTVKIINKITGQPLSKASIAVLGTTATTDAKGEAVIVLPTGHDTEPGKVKLSGYNDLSVSVKNTETVSADNTFAVTPSGKVYFLSKRTGTINVMKANLDGSDPQVVLVGTGLESDTGTVLLATRDWKYLALQSKRDSDLPKLYSIDTANDKVSLIDQGNANFSVSGWLNHTLIYTVERHGLSHSQAGINVLKGYDADKDSLNTLDQSRAEGWSNDYCAYESFSDVQILKSDIAYSRVWNACQYDNGYINSDSKNAVMSIGPTGSNKQVVYEFPTRPDGVWSNIQAQRNKPDEIYYTISAGQYTNYYELSDGKFSHIEKPADASDYYGANYITYIWSPSGDQTLWAESRDGKNALFLGDSNADSPQEVATASEYSPYGWYSDDYLLLSKQGSELYIAPREAPVSPVKISDYHKPSVNYSGYGSGYGGF